MDDLKKQNFYKNLSYPSKKLAETIILIDRKKQRTFYVTTSFMILLFLSTILVISKFKSNDFLILCIFMIILLIISIIYRPLEIINSTFKETKSTLIKQINSNHFCNCEKHCLCRDNFIKYMKEKKRIKLY